MKKLNIKKERNIMKNNKMLSFLVAFVLLVSMICTISVKAEQDVAVKNIIYMIPDGGGMSPFYLTDALKEAGGWDKNMYPNATIATGDGMHIEKYLVGSMTTYCSNAEITDSAAAGTAMSSGYKTKKSYVGVDPDKKPHANILEAAQYSGKNVGLVSTYEWTNATPAAFSAHDTARSNYTIMSEQIVNQDIDVVLGAGFGAAKWGSIKEAEKRGYDIIRTREDLNAVKPGDKIWGNLVENSFAYDIARKEHIPNIAEMTKAAITALDGDSENGFFLMVEGSKIDGGGHSNSASAMVGDYLAFDEACKVALEYAENRNDTIVIIAADHDTGGMVLPENMQKAVKELQKGEEPSELTWESTDHTARNVGLFMYVPEGVSYPEGISGNDVGTYKAYEENVVDNTVIAPYLSKLMNINMDEVTSKLFVDVTEKGTYDKESELFCFADNSCTIKRNTSYAFIGEKIVELDGQVALYVGGRFYVPQLLLDIIDGKATGTDAGDVLYPMGSHIDVYVADTADAIKWDGKIYIYNFFTEKEVGGEIRFTAPETLKGKTIKFDPIKGKDNAVIVAENLEFDVTAEDLTFDYDIITNDGHTYSFSTPFKGFAYAGYTDKTVVVDGVIDDEAWQNSVKMNCNKASQIVLIEDWKGDRDLSATFSILWDSEYFYFSAIVTDETFHQNEEPNKMWNGDSVQFGIYDDTDGLLRAGQAGKKFENITLGWVNGVPKAYRHTSQKDLTTVGEVVLNDDFDLKCKRSGDDLTYELKIKWSELFGYEYEPQRGNVLGFSVLINENDDGVSRKGWMEYGSGIGNKADASLFFVMPLLDFNKKDDEIKVLLNETKLDFDVQPMFVENKILLPARTVLENLGANVSWNSNDRIAISETENAVSEIPIGKTEFFVNGKSYTAQMPAQLINGRTLVSEDVLELVGECIIDYDMEKSIVTIRK